METASYIALSSQMALFRQLDVVANNIANASTPAFKAQRVGDVTRSHRSIARP